MTDEAVAGRNCAKVYNEILEKHPSWTPEILSSLPVVQMVALFTPADNVYHSFAEAAAAIRKRKEKEAGRGE